MASFTPGPWAYDGRVTRTIYAARDGFTEAPTICDVLDTTEGLEGSCRQADANGRLIAAAPDLLAACEAMIEAVDGSHAQVMFAIGVMKRAVAKAKGTVTA